MELHGYTSCLYFLHDRLHPASLHYMTDYILPLFITGLITSYLDRLHVPLHAPESITCSRIHYMALHSSESITCISCHYSSYMAFTCHLSMFLVFRALRRQGLPSLDHHQYLRPTLTQPAQRTRGQRHQRSLSRR